MPPLQESRKGRKRRPGNEAGKEEGEGLGMRQERKKEMGGERTRAHIIDFQISGSKKADRDIHP